MTGLKAETLARRKRGDKRRASRDAKNGRGYASFQTGLDFATVRSFLWAVEEDPTKWRYKRRNTVLGLWREMKQQLWQQHLEAREVARERKRRSLSRVPF
jgi:hypothetical protein